MVKSPVTALQRSDSSGNCRWMHYTDPVEQIEAYAPAEVIPALRKAEEAQRNGTHAIGWISYEASPAFDPHLVVHKPESDTPLLRFTLFRNEIEGLPPLGGDSLILSPFEPSLSSDQFAAKVMMVQKTIAAGETYQVNLTYPGSFTWSGSPRCLFRTIRMSQPVGYQAYLEEEGRVIVSSSPELFFRHKGTDIVCKPMKGTARPGAEHTLRASAKDQAENVMIVDMIRNDLGKTASTGRVMTNRLFEIERYASVVQMTSTISASGSGSPVDWLCSLFPCASITGAPKRKTMEWIHSLEEMPRGIYTGCIGGFFGDGETVFNVAIRTAILNRSANTARYHVGCGIVWDSDSEDEYRESLLKADILKHKPESFQLIETMRFEPEHGTVHLEAHLRRLVSTAARLGFELDISRVKRKVSESTADLHCPHKVRLLLSADGDIDLSATPLHSDTLSSPFTFRVDTRHTPSAHPELFFKTTRRSVYTDARKRHPDVDETLLINERGELMEFSIGNLVVEKDGAFFTPPLHSGLLNGIMRQDQIQKGKCTVKSLHPEDLEHADGVYLINAVRGWVRCFPGQETAF